MGRRPAPRLSAPLTLALLGLLVLGGTLLAALTGPFPISATQFFHAIGQRVFGEASMSASPIDTVLFGIRLPRIAAALLVGAALAGAGTVYQGL